MLHEDLDNIDALNERIEKAIDDSNFTELASLSIELQSLVQMLTSN